MDRGALLGRGSAKTVRRHAWRGREVAALWGCERHEIELLRSFAQSEHLLQLLAVLPGRIVLTELAPHGSLRDLGDTLDFERRFLTLAHCAAVVEQLVAALQRLWSARWVHGDVAARNVLVFAFDPNAPAATHIKLADFGDAQKEGRVHRDLKGLDEVRRDLEDMRGASHKQRSPPPCRSARSPHV